MSNNYGLNRYKQTSITTASRGQIIIMLYEGCIKFLRKASQAIEAKNISEKGTYIGKAQDIVNELNNSLNHDLGGDISRELQKLYDYIFEQTTLANINSDTRPIDVSIRLLETLLDGWKVAVTKAANGESGATNGTPPNAP